MREAHRTIRKKREEKERVKRDLSMPDNVDQWVDDEVDKIKDIASAKTYLKKFSKKVVKILLNQAGN